jgi:hypothetical protein
MEDFGSSPSPTVAFKMADSYFQCEVCGALALTLEGLLAHHCGSFCKYYYTLFLNIKTTTYIQEFKNTYTARTHIVVNTFKKLETKLLNYCFNISLQLA